MSMGIVQSPGVGRVLEWGALNSRAAVGEFWFFGTVGCLSRRFREDFWGELGASGGFGVTLGVLVGTLTLVRFPREKSRGSQSLGGYEKIFKEVWITYFSGIVQSILLRPVFYHFPILLDGGDLRSGPSSFSYILTKELKALKAKLKVWNKEIVGPQQRSLAMSRLESGKRRVQELVPSQGNLVEAKVKRVVAKGRR
ncbi:hypothetical protein CK203_003046 [Vitis vinifera]|uniref:Uncharacterized protein n=1 Tax=Vitis vinifera TaxID=29760 RepID=A0A438K7D9_VITVI|nr:hypothetical protein CK203_003046 [Vitis vinifera]